MSKREKGYGTGDKQCIKCMWLIDWLHFSVLKEKRRLFQSTSPAKSEHGEQMDHPVKKRCVETLFINNAQQHKQGRHREKQVMRNRPKLGYITAKTPGRGSVLFCCDLQLSLSILQILAGLFQAASSSLRIMVMCHF